MSSLQTLTIGRSRSAVGLSVVDLNAIAAKLERPFALSTLATVGELTLSGFLCQGQMSWHKHLDEDELFLVHEGVVVLETTRGKLTLHSEEVAVVPKGLSHRSSSQLRSIVLLLRPSVLTERKNGHRTHPLDTDPPLEKVRLARVSTTMSEYYRPTALARVEDYELLLVSAQDAGPAEVAPPFGALWLVIRGGLQVAHAAKSHRLDAGHLIVVPAGDHYQLTAAPGTLAVTIGRAVGTGD
jgi:mannose-6-phosphate isomerase-like protein (cupin superfamily)